MHARNVGKSAVALLLSKASFPAREKLSSRTELGGSAFCDSCFLAHHVRVSSGEKSECSTGQACSSTLDLGPGKGLGTIGKEI